MEQYHIPVLLEESIEYLIADKSGTYFDGTIGFGGHSAEFLSRLNPDAKLIATELDGYTYSFTKEKFRDDSRVRVYNTNFSQIDVLSKIEFVRGFDGVFADLGVSSFQFDDPEHGFTYRTESPLDLRLSKELKLKASDIINNFSEEEIASILWQYGEEKNSRKIARRIAEARSQKRIVTTLELASVIEAMVPQPYVIKTLSRVFQALRIYVNDELGVLKEFLGKSLELLKPGGRIVILTYHSLEDRIVKDFFKNESTSCICPPEFPVCVCDKLQRLEILTRKPVAPRESEIKLNRRARSAKLRAAQKIQ